MIEYNPEDEEIIAIATSMKKPFSFSVTVGEKTADLSIFLSYLEYEDESCVFSRIDIDKDTVFDSCDNEENIQDSLKVWIDDEFPDEYLQNEKMATIDEIFGKIWDFIEEKGMC